MVFYEEHFFQYKILKNEFISIFTYILIILLMSI